MLSDSMVNIVQDIARDTSRRLVGFEDCWTHAHSTPFYTFSEGDAFSVTRSHGDPFSSLSSPSYPGYSRTNPLSVYYVMQSDLAGKDGVYLCIGSMSNTFDVLVILLSERPNP